MHFVDDWLEHHSLDADVVRDVIAVAWARGGPETPFADRDFGDGTAQSVGLLGDLRTCYDDLVIPALSAAFSDPGAIRAALAAVAFGDHAEEAERVPHTVDRGAGRAPLIVMGWNGTPEDLLCLAHEAAHAAQITLSATGRMPPVARETCAFLGELALIEGLRTTRPDLAGALHAVWLRENDTYLGDDLAALASALDTPGAAYQYRQNYPLARLAAVELALRGPRHRPERLFAAGPEAMADIPIAAIAARAREIANPLPPMPAGDGMPALAYRRLGAVALLDLESWQQAATTPIGGYYEAGRDRLSRHAVALTLDGEGRPVGHAAWDGAVPGAPGAAPRICAPFGHHREVRAALSRAPSEGSVA